MHTEFGICRSRVLCPWVIWSSACVRNYELCTRIPNLLRFWMMIFGFLIGAGIGLFAIHQIGFGEKDVLCSGNDRGKDWYLPFFLLQCLRPVFFYYGSRYWADDYCIYYPSDYFFQLFHLSSGGSRSRNAGASLRKSDHCGNQYSGWYLKWLFCCPSWQKWRKFLLELFFPLGSPLVGMLIQFAINKPKYDDDYDDEEDEDRGKYQKDDINGKKLTGRRLKARQSAEGKKRA